MKIAKLPARHRLTQVLAGGKIENSKMPRILVILGPTAGGKSAYAVKMAKKLNGEIVSADSRQVYKGLNIGSGKITKKEMKGVPHHLLDIRCPRDRFTVNDYQKLAYKEIDKIISNGKLPIICGGTGFYIQSIVDGIVLPDVNPQKKLRDKLNKLSTKELFKKLKKVDPIKAKFIDANNRVRLIRAIEIATVLGRNKKLIKKPKYEVKQIGIKLPFPVLRKKIENRLLKRLKAGMINEAKKLHKNGLTFQRMEELGLEYRYLALYLQGKITKSEMIKTLKTKIFQFAKKQMTWFKRDMRIKWITLK